MTRAFPNKITLADFCERWPKDASGMRARTLMMDFLGTMLVDSAISRTDTAEERSGAHRAIAKILENVRGVTADRTPPKTITASPPLHRHIGDQPQTPKKPE